MAGYRLAPAVTVFFRYWQAVNSETGLSHRLTAYKIVEHLFGLSYRVISLNNQVDNRFFRLSNISVPCPHAQLRGRTVIKKLWTSIDGLVRLSSGKLSYGKLCQTVTGSVRRMFVFTPLETF